LPGFPAAENMDKFELSLSPMNETNANMINPVSLAYLGDTVYDLFVRTYMVKNKLGTISTLHNYASSMVNAKAQAIAAEYLMDFLTEEEKAIYRRGRNAKSGGVPKNMEVADYRKATGIEAVLGYLYVLGRQQRLNELMKMVMDNFFMEG
jgi:ribonuclease-3 family protein